MTKLELIKKHYWACAECMNDAGGVRPEDAGVCTVTSGACKVCGAQATLWPWVDFDWPKSRNDDFNAKMGRD